MFHYFLVCSGIAAAVNIAVGFLLYGVAGLDGPVLYPVSVAFAFLAGMGVSFVLNRRFTYESSGRRVGAELPDFLMVSLGGLLLTTGLSFVFLTYGATPIARLTLGLLPVETGAHMAAVGLTAFYSFLAHKHISFRRAPTMGSAAGTGSAQAVATR